MKGAIMGFNALPICRSTLEIATCRLQITTELKTFANQADLLDYLLISIMSRYLNFICVAFKYIY